MKALMRQKVLAVVMILAFGLNSTACSTTWLSTFDGYLQVAGPILIQILDIVALAKGTPVPAQLEAKITADQASLNSLAASVQSAASTNVQGACAQFNLAVQTFAGDLSAIEQLANVSNSATQNEINAAVSIAQQAIAEVETPIAACQSAPGQTAALAALQLTATGITSPNDIVKRFNAVVDAKHHVHLHNKFMRIVSFGKLQ